MGSEAAALLEAADFAAGKHKGQRRKDPEGTPFINHPIGAEPRQHPHPRDTDTTFSEIEERFGAEVRRVVEEVTDDKALPKMERKRLQIERAAGSSPRAKLVKLADKLHNLRDINRCTPAGWTPQRVQEYFRWAAQVVAGLRGTSPPLEAALRRLFEERGLHPDPEPAP
ncbi:MESH1 pyrophosphohydrolase, partial [Cepphus grylle]|nr:MESH1 pyrophosphohydrolase [Cepphus grylle]